MPNYNSAQYVSMAIESILGQTFRDFELIVVDDGSTDESIAIIEEYIQRDPRIVFVKNEKNEKICQTLNRGLSLSRGKYIARMDSDDIADSARLMKQVAYLDEHEDIAIV